MNNEQTNNKNDKADTFTPRTNSFLFTWKGKNEDQIRSEENSNKNIQNDQEDGLKFEFTIYWFMSTIINEEPLRKGL